MARGRKKQTIVNEKEKIMDTVDEQKNETVVQPMNTSQASSADIMHVRLCHAGPVSFAVGNKVIEINGSNMGIKRDQRRPLEIGEFGKTVVNAADWQAIVEKYGHKKLFKNEYIKGFANESDADAFVAGFGGNHRHGLDPVDPNNVNTEAKTD